MKPVPHEVRNGRRHNLAVVRNGNPIEPLAAAAMESLRKQIRKRDKSGKATREQFCAIEFEPVEYFKGYHNDPKKRSGHTNAHEELGVGWRLAIAVMAMSKPELIEAALGMHKVGGFDANIETAERLAEARDIAESVYNLINAAELRHMAALHNVYDDDGERITADPA
jgi:hypothetical protein